MVEKLLSLILILLLGGTLIYLLVIKVYPTLFNKKVR
jgi:hypothetical protein